MKQQPHKQLLELMKKLQSQKGTYSNRWGICNYLDKNGTSGLVKLFNTICKKSKGYSGEYGYPILGGRSEFYRITTPEEKWFHGDYAEARWEMVDFVIWYLETTWWKKVWYKFTGDMK